MGAGGQIGNFKLLKMKIRAAVFYIKLSFVRIGAELTDFVLVLNTKEAVKTFSHFGNVQLGGNVSSR